MRILPEVTTPAIARIERAHRPARRHYSEFRPCLRWEFGFSCAFCLVHESDLSEHGVIGTGLSSIEHQVPKSREPRLTSEYSNCFYSCRFCNNSRVVKPNRDRRGRRLLDPCAVAWSDHFAHAGFALRPVVGDDDAQYTAEAYRLNDPRRQAMRRNRARAIGEASRILREAPPRIVALLGVANTAREGDRQAVIESARLLRAFITQAKATLRRFAVIPLDHDAPCGCTARRTELPGFLATQLMNVDLD